MPWQHPLNFPVLQDNQVHIWRATLKQSKQKLSELYNLLNQQEKDRAAKFIVEHAHNSFIVARGILRHLLAKYLFINPQKLELQQNQHGKLHLIDTPLQFNISHSHDWALFAFTLHHPIGIDVEFIRDNFDFIDIAQRFFSKNENHDLMAMPQEQQRQAFFNCWSRKEAFIKALGKGMFYPLDEFSVEVSNKKEGKLKIQFTNREFDDAHWSLEALNPADIYVGAFATSAQQYKVEFYNF